VTTLVQHIIRGAKKRIKKAIAKARHAGVALRTAYAKTISTPFNLRMNARKADRKLEIGPGNERISGFETLNVIWDKNVDYIADASDGLPFEDNTFVVVYASHVLEHIPWYKTEATLKEWFRITQPGGAVEIFVPNGLLIAETFVDAETKSLDRTGSDGWYKFNDRKDPCVWANGRIYSYGDGTGDKGSPNWHLALFSPRYLTCLLQSVGFIDVQFLRSEDVRGYDHGWINLGVSGKKPWNIDQ
jgi:SAM-dependent methyltransferase